MKGFSWTGEAPKVLFLHVGLGALFGFGFRSLGSAFRGLSGLSGFRLIWPCRDRLSR